MKDTLEHIIKNELGWNWSYGRRDFQNLEEPEAADDPKPFFFMDPPVREDERSSDSGLKTGWTKVSGKFMILLKSDLDQNYDQQKGQAKEDGKFDKHIKPVIEDKLDSNGEVVEHALINQLENIISCPPYDWHIKAQRVQEVINLFDNNYDGALVTFSWRLR